MPFPGRCGLAEVDPGELGDAVLGCWDDFLAVVEHPDTDLTGASRLPGWSGAEVCVHLGAWDDHRVLAGLTAAARAGGGDPPTAPDAESDRLRRAHAGASPADVVDAVRRARDAVEQWFDSGLPAELGRAGCQSAVGPLPVLSLVQAGCYELAVHALDLAPCGAPHPSAHLLDRGLAALVDVTGALATRSGVHITLTGSAPTGAWSFTSEPDGWTTRRAAPGPFEGVGARGRAHDLLDASAGRQNVAQLMVSRRLVVQHLPAWMRLAPLLTEVPGLPGGAALRTAVGGLGGVTKVLGRFLR